MMAASQLNSAIKINYPVTVNSSQFVYDGRNHFEVIVEKTGGSIVSTKQFIYDRNSICESRDSAGNELMQYFEKGQFDGSTKYFYGQDHLGSVREMLTAGNVLEAEYSYSPWGEKFVFQESVSSDFQFSRYYFHVPGQLSLAVHRAYSSKRARWVNRDPILERGGVNMYTYVGNAPVYINDPSGFAPHVPGLPPAPPPCDGGCNGDILCICINQCSDPSNILSLVFAPCVSACVKDHTPGDPDKDSE